MTDKYREYFDIDEEYFPQINDYSIAASPDFWTRTYPHQTFINMLNSMERILARQEKRSLWIEGAYGTGKSQCAYTLKKILEAPEEGHGLNPLIKLLVHSDISGNIRAQYRAR